MSYIRSKLGLEARKGKENYRQREKHTVGQNVMNISAVCFFFKVV